MEFESLIRIYLENKNMNKSKALEAIKNMKQLEEEGKASFGRHFYYEAQLCYEYAELDKCLSYALKAIHSLIKGAYVPEIAKSYNIMGVVYNSKGDSLQALDWYLDALDLVNKNNDVKTSSGIYNNIGCIYDDLDDPHTAIEYFTKALKTIGDHDAEIYTLEMINLALMYCEIEDWDMARYYYDCVCRTKEGYVAVANEIHLSIIHALMAYHENDEEEVRKQLVFIFKKGKDKELNANHFFEILNSLPKLMDIKFKDEISNILDTLSNTADLLELLDAKLKLLENRIELQKILEHEEDVLSLSRQYYELLKEKKKERSKLLIDGTNLKLQMKQMMQEHQEMEKTSLLYKERAQHDELTGLYNRSMLKDRLEPLFKRAIQEEKTVGVLICDINDFKQYNDYYGHVAGDHCIRELTSVMLRLCNDNVHFLRYGGDEFLGFFYDIDEETIKSMVSLIHSEIRALNIEHMDSSTFEKIVSITEGAYIGIPSKKDNFYDFIAKADDALYKGKRDGKLVVIHLA